MPVTQSARGISFLLLGIFSSASFAANATCGAFWTGGHDPMKFCSGVVDYPYLIPAGQTVESMNTAVRALAARTYIQFYPTACKEQIKRLLCAQTYLPCANGIAIKKPCKSMCQATTGLDGVCRGLLERHGYQPNCSNAVVFDPSNDPNVCNALTNVQGKNLVASRNEPYIGSVCTNYVEDYFVPEASVFYSPLAPMPLPYLFQGYQEATAATWLNHMPKFVSSECLTAFHKVVCAVSFMKPQANEELSFRFGSIHLPQFPARELCTNYMDKCSWILDIAPALGLNCEESFPGWDGNPMYMYPETSQYVTGLMFGGRWVVLATDPNRMDTELAEETVIETQCPYSTVVPEDKSLSGVSMATDGCALACPDASWTTSEYEKVSEVVLSIRIIILFGLGWVLSNFLFIQKSKSNVIMVASVSFYVLAIAVRVILRLITQPGDGSEGCSSNASPYALEDVDSDGYGACVASATVKLLLDVISFYLVGVTVIEIWFKVMCPQKDIWKRYKLHVRIGCAALFVLWIMGYFLGTDTVFVRRNSCNWNATDNMTQFWSLHFIFVILYVMIAGTSIYILWHSIKTSSAAGANSLSKIWNSYKYLMGLITMFIICWGWAIAYFYIFVLLFQKDAYENSMTSWTNCLFDHFVSSDDKTYLSVCGTTPEVRYPVYAGYMEVCIDLFAMLVHVFISANNSQVKKFYLGIVDSLFSRSLVAGVISKTIVESRYETKMESKAEQCLEMATKKPSPVVNSQLKSSKIVPLEEECPATDRSDDVSVSIEKPSGSIPIHGSLDNIEEAPRTFTNGDNIDRV